MFLGGFEIIAVIGIIVWLTKRSRAKQSDTAPAPISDVLNTWLQRWRSAGLLSDDEVQAIISFEQSNEIAASETDHMTRRVTSEVSRSLPKHLAISVVCSLP
jgi:hypothetical protein